MAERQEGPLVRVDEPESQVTSKNNLLVKQPSKDKEGAASGSHARTSSIGSRLRSNFTNLSPGSKVRNRSPSRMSSSLDMDDVTLAGGETAAGEDDVVLSPQSSLVSGGNASLSSSGGAREFASGGRERENEGGKREGASEKVKEPKDSSAPESDGKAETVKKKEKEKRGFFSPRHRGSMFPFSSIFSSSHRHKNLEIHKIFTSLADAEKLVDDYSCALQRDILIHGRLYVTQNWLCFYANIFSWETLLTIPLQSVQAITKEKTALVIPNAIQIATTAEKYGFSSLINRDCTYNIIFKVWQNSLLNQPLSPLELVRAAKKAWGENTHVGSEEELWGPSSSPKEEDEASERVKKQMSLPTHLEIGLLPSTTKPSAIDTPFLTVPEAQPLPTHTGSEGAESGAGLENERERDKLTHSDDTTLTEASSDVPMAAVSLPVRFDPGKLRRQAAHMEENADMPPAKLPKSMSSKPPIYENGSDSSHMTNAHSHVGVLSEHPSTDVMSIGGESAASSEYETISFTDETGEIPCGCSEHTGRTIINEVYAADVETVFQLLFTDSDFIRGFLKARKTINVEISEWQPQSNGTRLRDMSYTVSLNYSFGPKFSPSTEHQIYSKMGQPGLKHIVDTEVVNANIPYSDTFFVSCRYCITRVAHDKTRVKVIANINFKKNCWGLVKNLIERNAGDGVRSYYTHMDTYLKEYLANVPVRRRRPHRRAKRNTSRTRHRRPSSATKPPSSPPPAPVAHEAPPPSPATPIKRRLTSTTSLKSFQMDLIEEARHPPPVQAAQAREAASYSRLRINLALTLLLGLLIISNMALYHHLRSYQPLGPPATSFLPPSSSPGASHQQVVWPTSQEEWISLVRRQLETHDREIERWQRTVYSLVQSLEQVEHTIGSAKKMLLTQMESYAQRSGTAVGEKEDLGDNSPSSSQRDCPKSSVDGSLRHVYDAA